MANYTLPTDANETIIGIQTYIKWIQEPGVSNGIFFPWILFAVYIITILLLKGYENSKSFAASSFFFMIIAIISRTLGLLSNDWMYLSIMLTALGIIWVYLEGTES